MTTIQPTEQPARWLVTGGPETYTGITHLGELTGVDPALTATYAEGEMAALEAMAAQASAFLPLPVAGWLEQGAIYQWDDTLVMVRQSHNRTEHDPATVPALFIVYRVDADAVLDWIAGEQVDLGTRRVYDGVTYECLQAHVTEATWTPVLTLNVLWAVVQVGPDIPAWVAGVYALDALVTHAGRTWKSLMAANGYEPGVVGTWRDQSALPLWVAPAGAVGLWQIGDECEYAGHRWRCTVANNSWQPGVYGWTDLGIV